MKAAVRFNLRAFLKIQNLRISPSLSFSRIHHPSFQLKNLLKEGHIDDEENLDHVGLRRHKIEIDGVSLNWDQAGKGSHVVLMMPGIVGCIQNDYAPIFRKMDKENFTLVSWDPPGYGLSRPPERDFSGVFYKRDSDLVVKLMDKLGHDKFSVLGWSNGGISGYHMAADYPDRVKSLVSWGSHAYADDQAIMFTKIMRDLNIWSPKMLEPVLSVYGRETLQKMLNDWYISVKQFRESGLNSNLHEKLPRVKCPVLVLHGEEDPVLGIEHAEFLKNHVQNGRLMVMPKAKHNLHLKFVDKFVGIVEQFLLDYDLELSSRK